MFASPGGAVSFVFLAVLFVALPVLAARTHRSGQALALPRPALYASAALTQWILVALLAAVLWLEGADRASIGLGAWPGALAVLAWAAGTAAAGLLIGGLHLWLRRRLGRPEARLVHHLLPRTRREECFFAFLVAPTAGIAEELLYRGFAVTRLAPLVGSAWTAAAIAALAFGLGHVYQGPLGVARATILGFVLAVPFVVTGSLAAAIVAHTALDLLGGLLLRRWLLDE